jgi:hypothetical protein
MNPGIFGRLLAFHVVPRHSLPRLGDFMPDAEDLQNEL